MALATRCPSCTTVFRIGTAQAAAKGGMVRCGVCRNVFNSLDALVRVEDLDVVEEVILQVPVSTPAAPEAAPQPPAATPPPPQSQVPPEPLQEPEPQRQPEPAPALPDLPAAAPVEAEPAVASSAEAIPVPPVDEQAIIREWWMPIEEPTTSSSRTLEAELVEEPIDALAPSGIVRRSEPRLDSSVVDGTNPVFMRPRPTYEPASRAWRWLLGLMCLLATLALLAQLAYIWRDELAVRWPPARPWLTAACNALRCTVGYPVHEESITIESAVVQTVATNANVYVMTALLRNRDSVDLRYPTLELVLTDLQDQPILRRDFRPPDYLVGVPGHSPSSGFPAQSELPIRITFELSDLRFAGYRLAQFYP